MHTTALKDKTMIPRSGFFQANFSTTVLRSAALAIALIVLASPAHAEVATLVCIEESGGSFTLQVDYDRKTVALLLSDGTAYRSSPATITEGAVTWSLGGVGVVVPGDPSNPWFDGSLNRLSGRGMARYYLYRDDGLADLQSRVGACRRATQKF